MYDSEDISDVSLSPAESLADVLEELPILVYTYGPAPSRITVCADCEECNYMRRSATKMARCGKRKRKRRVSCRSARKRRMCSKPKKRCSKPRKKVSQRRKPRACPKPC